MSASTGPVRHLFSLGDLQFGQALGQLAEKATTNGPSPQSRSSNWHFQPGTYTPKQFMGEIAILLESVITQLGPDPPGSPSTRDILMDGLRSSLSHEGRESTLPLPDWRSKAPSEMTRQSMSIGKKLQEYAWEYNHAVQGNPSLTVYSPCEGHRWVPPAGQLLRSRRSSPLLMMIYNEWLHQITCLRDNLLAFENFEDVRLELNDADARGTRPMELVREDFLFNIRAGRATDSNVLEIAKVLTAPNLPTGGYGFQYRHGTVLPASLFNSIDSKLVRYIPAKIDGTDDADVVFDFVKQNGQVAREDLNTTATVPSVQDEKLANSRVTSAPIPGAKKGINRALQMNGEFENGSSFAVDFSDIIQGVRKARQANVSAADGGSVLVHSASQLLSSGKGWKASGSETHAIKATSKVVQLALFGRVEPGTAVLGFGEHGASLGALALDPKAPVVILA